MITNRHIKELQDWTTEPEWKEICNLALQANTLQAENERLRAENVLYKTSTAGATVNGVYVPFIAKPTGGTE